MEVQLIYDAVKELTVHIIELKAKQEAHTVILQEHKNYSLALQKEQEKIDLRLIPIEKQHQFIALIVKVSGIVAVGGGINYAIKHLLG